jgi:hypothetical protein
MRWRLTILAAALALSVAPGAATASTHSPLPGTPVPQGFVGVDLDGPPLSAADHIDLAHQLDLMVANGVQTVRLAFSWAAAQPYASWSDVPADQVGQFVDVNNVPTNFNLTDEVMGLAAQRGLTLLPTVLYAPGWDAGSNPQGKYPPPARTGPYADYLTALIRRYGPHGTFWSDHSRRLPIRMWQIWNEENLSYYWPQPFAKTYVSLLKASRTAIRRADPGAKVVLGALTNTAWKYLAQVNKIRGAHRAFDVIAVNGFTSTPSNVIRYLQYTRRAANREGEKSKPLLATELSWPSAKGKSPQHYSWNTTEQGQAAKISALLPMLAAHRAPLNLAGFDYYTWMGAETRHAPAFSFAGLLRFDSAGQVVAKPALGAYRRGVLALEGCRKKGRTATDCVR